MDRYTAGIDLGGTGIKFGIFTPEGKLIRHWSIKTDRNHDGENIIKDMVSSLKENLKLEEIPSDALTGIGLGVPGVIKRDGDACTCVNLGWKDKNVRKELSRLSGYPVSVLNDANAAALGEMWQGSAKGYKDLVLITLGTGIGGGIILNGSVVKGAFGAGGEIGHMSMGVETDTPCACGRYGCLEQLSSATGMTGEMRRRILSGEKETIIHKDFSTKEIFSAAEKGDELALDLVDWAALWLGKAMARISSIIDPEVYILGGGVSQAGDTLMGPVKKHFKEQAFASSREARIILAGLGSQAGIYGAAKSALDELHLQRRE